MFRTISNGRSSHPSPSHVAPQGGIPVSKCQFCRRSCGLVCHASGQNPVVGIFPAGQKQARVQLPAVMIEVEAKEVLENKDVLQMVDTAVSSGATAVILGDVSSVGDSALYEASLQLREVLRERASLLLLDRPDVAFLTQASGVVLSDKGFPPTMARSLFQGRPALIGRRVSTADAAGRAAAEGVNFILLMPPPGLALPPPDVVTEARASQRSKNSIPIILSCTSLVAPDSMRESLARAPEGFSLPLSMVEVTAQACTPFAGGEMSSWMGALLTTLDSGLQESGPVTSHDDSERGSGVSSPSGTKVKVDGSALRKLINQSREALLADEKAVLKEVLSLLEQVCPSMGEVDLLREALQNLDDLFLVVVVGEFNSGKSTFINALLGRDFLAQGVLPTTNEISVLKYLEAGKSQEPVMSKDGLYYRYLPADLLRELNIVDTPGTNVILERQQRLTEEFVPKADLVVFLMSADRPFTDSELRFLDYIKQWKKKIVFVINKVDMLDSDSEVQEVCQFVADNARKVLGFSNPPVLPVSSRKALKAKKACGEGPQAVGGILNSWEDEMLSEHPDWESSNFGTLERFVFEYLIGRPKMDGAQGPELVGGEGVRLKLQTPLNVADALLGLAARQLAAELAAAENELENLRLVRAQWNKFQVEMKKDSEVQRTAAKRVVQAATERCEKFVDRTLNLSNVVNLFSYVTASDRSRGDLPVARGFDKEVVQGGYEELKRLVQEHTAWLTTNCSNQSSYYSKYLASRGLSVGPSKQEAMASSNGTNGAGQSLAISGTPLAPSTTPSSSPAPSSISGASSQSVRAVLDFNISAAATLLEEEIKEAFLGTAGSAAGAQGVGLVAANMLHSGLEDILALTIAGLASYVAVLNLPLRRTEIKGKVGRLAGKFLEDLEGRMVNDLESSLESTGVDVLALLEPIETMYEEEVARLVAAEQRREKLENDLAELQQRTANMK